MLTLPAPSLVQQYLDCWKVNLLFPLTICGIYHRSLPERAGNAPWASSWNSRVGRQGVGFSLLGNSGLYKCAHGPSPVPEDTDVQETLLLPCASNHCFVSKSVLCEFYCMLTV